MPNSPRCVTAGTIGPQSLGPLTTSITSASTNGPSPKGSGLPPPSAMVSVRPRDSVATAPRPLVQYNEPNYAVIGVAQPKVVTQPQPPVPQPQPVVQASQPLNAQPTTTQVTTVATPPTPVLTSVQRYLADSTSKFFGVNGDDGNEKVWMERRRRLAIKLFGGVKDDFQLDGTTYEDSLVRLYNYQEICTVHTVSKKQN